jgi:hypothetical protein
MTIEDVIRLSMQHALDRPNHGFDCACMDEVIRRLRAELEPLRDLPRHVQNRVSYVIRAATR